MKPHQKKSLKYLLIIAGLITLYLTGLHKPIAATLQRGMLMTGLFNPSLNEVPEKTDKVVVKGKNTPEVVPGDMADLDVQFFNEAGELVNLSAMPQQPYFINFWATWCPPCIAEMPGIAELYADKKETVNFVLVSFDTDFEKAKAFKVKKGYDFPIYRVAYDLPDMYNTGSLPTTIVIDAQGRLALNHMGIANYDTKEFREYLDSLQE
ncbi:MAG: thioredoxin [Rhizobiales bacterium]|uniref:TlpA family protein disulfide reductase n=1 Tax=unclassified Leeuwenhoekiella TaxID=2615029 RepID=UPI000C3A5748|nr:MULTISPECIES: TlpA disulfide reductase family protein [unclassified Leeuwenhoekiella]MAW96880.1 thioredoxin [Leeuwenhoekiella sp.]MBA67583.1 thioredoxin [Hyphomicrobiales bacterium]|tara:strand:+ start:1070 stop:1693 length:624 start_codon:yes stop_codon:yes gene_type:complete